MIRVHYCLQAGYSAKDLTMVEGELIQKRGGQIRDGVHGADLTNY